MPEQSAGTDVVKKGECCDPMKQAIEAGNILVDDLGVWIYGRPSFASDGDNRFDDMTEQLDISFCPWCGNKLASNPEG